MEKRFIGKITLQDTESYSRPDSGCPYASEYIGKQSECFTCPFPQCHYDVGIINKRRQAVMEYAKQGKSTKEIAAIMLISVGSVNRYRRFIERG